MSNIPIGFNSDGRFSPMSDGCTDFEHYDDEDDDEIDECE